MKAINWSYLAGFFDGEGSIFIKINDRYGEEIVVKKGYCFCGCGKRTSLASKTYIERGWIKGKPLRYINGHNNVITSKFQTIRCSIPQSASQSDVIYDIAGFLQDEGFKFSLLEYDIGKCPMSVIQINRQVDNYLFISKLLPYLRVEHIQAKKALKLLETSKKVKELTYG